MLELLERTRDYLRGKEEKKVATFAELVKVVADGAKKQPTPAQIDEALEAAGKTLEDLDAAVSYRQTRHELARQFATVPALEKEQQEVGQQYQAELARFAELKTAHERTAGPLLSRSYQLAAEIHKAKACEEQLRTGYVGELIQELEAIEFERQRIHKQAEPIQATRDHHALRLRSIADPESKHPTNPDEIAAHQRALAAADELLGGLRARLPGLQAREEEINHLIIQP